MQDPWNPQRKELRAWAYDSEANWPEQDFDLSVAEVHFGDLIIEFTIDNNCPKRDFFLSCAYIIVGDAVMTDYQSRSKEAVLEFLNKVKDRKDERLTLLYNRSVELLGNPTSFDYDLWCSEGYVKQSSDLKSEK